MDFSERGFGRTVDEFRWPEGKVDAKEQGKDLWGDSTDDVGSCLIMGTAAAEYFGIKTSFRATDEELETDVKIEEPEEPTFWSFIVFPILTLDFETILVRGGILINFLPVLNRHDKDVLLFFIVDMKVLWHVTAAEWSNWRQYLSSFSFLIKHLLFSTFLL